MDTDRRRERWFWIITSALAVATVAALYILAGPEESNTTAIQITKSASPPRKPATDPERSPPGAGFERSADTRMTTVFECHVNGQRIYSDQRCGSTTQEHPIRAPNRMQGQDTGILLSPDEVLARSRAERAYAQEPILVSAQADCSRIEDQKNSIDARMRRGYTASEGEWFRDSLRALSAQYYDLGCRHFH